MRLERQMRELAIDNVEGKLGDDVFLERLRHLRESLLRGHVARARLMADLIHAIYERIVVVGREFISVRRMPTDWPWSCLRLFWRPRQDSNLRPAA